jgi:hypothetical protein
MRRNEIVSRGGAAVPPPIARLVVCFFGPRHAMRWAGLFVVDAAGQRCAPRADRAPATRRAPPTAGGRIFLVSASIKRPTCRPTTQRNRWPVSGRRLCALCTAGRRMFGWPDGGHTRMAGDGAAGERRRRAPGGDWRRWAGRQQQQHGANIKSTHTGPACGRAPAKGRRRQQVREPPNAPRALSPDRPDWSSGTAKSRPAAELIRSKRRKIRLNQLN